MSNRKNGNLMKKIFNPAPETWPELLRRPTQTVDDIEETVNGIFKDVQANGDSAVAKYTAIFDGVSLDAIYASAKEIDEASTSLSQELKDAIQLAKKLSLIHI